MKRFMQVALTRKAVVVIAILALLAVPLVALADNVQNDVTVGGNDTFFTGGSTTVNYRITANSGDGQTGCNASDGSPASVTINVPAGVTASPNPVSFTACGVNKPVTFTSTVTGDFEITVSVSDSGAGGYNTNPAKFTLHVFSSPNTPPSVSVTGVTNGASYEYGTVPAAGCAVTDAQDGNSSFAATLSAISGPLSFYGLGSRTASCSYTDGGGLSASASATYSIVDTTKPVIEAHADVTAEATGPTGATVSYTSPATHDAVFGDGVATCAPPSGTLFALGDTTVTCNASDGAGNAAVPTSFVVHVVDTTPPTFSCGSADSAWHTTDQSVACTASDGGSGLATPASFSLSTSVAANIETDSAYTNSQNVCDLAGNCVTAGPVGPFKIDQKAPSVSASPDRIADYNGWYNHALTVSFFGTDGGSGVASCDAPVNFSGPDNASASVSGSCIDQVGNTASASFDFQYDGTAPTAALSVTDGTLGANGWYVSDVTVHTSGTGGISGVTCTADQFQTTDTTGTEFNGACTSGAGLTTYAAPLTVKLDKTGPTAVLSTSGTLGNNGWYVSNVTISTSGTDDISAPVTCTPDQFQTTDTAGTEFNGACTNDAGLSTDAAPLTIKRDVTAPVINASVSPARPASGWWNIASGAPTVTYSCSDGTSGVASCTAPYTFPQNADQTHNGTAIDNAGNSSSAGVSDIDVDLTAPTLTWNGGPANGASYYFGSVPAAPTCAAADAPSGPNGCSVSGYGTTVGSHTLIATAHDVANNEYSEQRTYTVMAWTLYGFYQPVDMGGVFNIVKNGSTVPLKFELFAGSTELTDVGAVDTLTYAQVTCAATAPQDEIETLATGNTVLRYDATAGQFIYNWKTPSGTAGKCFRVTMKADDGSSLVAFFKMK